MHEPFTTAGDVLELLDPEAELAGVLLDPHPVTVLVADDHPLFRRGIARAVQRHPLLRLVGEARDGTEALELIDALEPDVAVLDVRMPGLSGVDVCAELQARAVPPATAVLLLSAFEDRAIVADAACAGAAGYLGKTASPREITEAIEQVGTGEVAFTGRSVEGFNRAVRRRASGGGS